MKNSKRAKYKCEYMHEEMLSFSSDYINAFLNSDSSHVLMIRLAKIKNIENLQCW